MSLSVLSRGMLRPQNLLRSRAALRLPSSLNLRAAALPLLGPRARGLATEDGAAPKATGFDALKPRLAQGAVVAGSALAAYGVSVFVFDLTYYFLAMTPGTVGYYSFIAGFGSAGLCFGIGAAAYSAFAIRPEFVFQRAHRLVRSSSISTEKLGGSITAGALRAYKIDQAGFGLGAKNALSWQNPRVQMIFDVKGRKHRGLVTVEGIKERGSLNLTFVGLDVMNDAEERVLLHGSEQRMYVKDQLRELIDFKRASRPGAGA